MCDFCVENSFVGPITKNLYYLKACRLINISVPTPFTFFFACWEKCYDAFLHSVSSLLPSLITVSRLYPLEGFCFSPHKILFPPRKKMAGMAFQTTRDKEWSLVSCLCCRLHHCGWGHQLALSLLNKQILQTKLDTGRGEVSISHASCPAVHREAPFGELLVKWHSGTRRFPQSYTSPNIWKTKEWQARVVQVGLLLPSPMGRLPNAMDYNFHHPPSASAW